LLFSGCLIDQIGGAFKQKLAPSVFMEKPGWGTDEALE